LAVKNGIITIETWEMLPKTGNKNTHKKLIFKFKSPVEKFSGRFPAKTAKN
jgi:hypothetical protein